MKASHHLLIFIALLFLAEPSIARQSRPTSGPSDEDMASGAFPGEFMVDMETVNYMIDQNAYRSALEKLEEMHEDNQFGRQGFGDVTILMMLGYVHALLNEIDIAIDYYEKALASRVLTTPKESQAVDDWAKSTRQNALYTLANLVAAQAEDYERAIELLHEWFQGEDLPTAEAYMLMGNLYAALEQFEEALPYMDEALARADRPIESWYRSTLSVQLQLEKHAAAIDNLKTMLTFWADRPMYWDTLARLHSNNGDTRLAFDTVMSAHANGMLDTRYRVMMLVRLSVSNEVPFAGATVLESAIEAGILEENRDNLDILIDTWTYAREYARAIEAIGKIAEFAEPGPYYLQAARLYLQSGGWQGAIDSAEKALENDIRGRAQALTILGMASLELKDYEQSLAAFREILDVGNSREKENAQNWVDFVEEARANRELLSAAQ